MKLEPDLVRDVTMNNGENWYFFIYPRGKRHLLTGDDDRRKHGKYSHGLLLGASTLPKKLSLLSKYSVAIYLTDSFKT